MVYAMSRVENRGHKRNKSSGPMIGENRKLVTNEAVEFEK